MKKTTTVFLAIVFFAVSAAFAADGLSVGGSLDVNMGSNMNPYGSGSLNIEYRPFSMVSIGFKISGQTNFNDRFSAVPSVFARLYPFSGAFAEGSIGGSFSWANKVTSKNMSAGASIGWRITAGNTYIEPKINMDYVFGAAEPYSWSAGVGAGYSF